MRDRWGHWKYNPNNLTLEIAKKGAGSKSNPFYVNLEKCNTSAEILDWIFQIKNTQWCSDQDIADLLRAFDDLMDFVQSKVCSDGKDHTFDFKSHLLDKRDKEGM